MFIRVTLLFLFVFLFPPITFAESVPFRGQVDFLQKQFDLTLDLKHQGKIATKVVAESPHKYSFLVNVDNFKTSLLTISSILEGTLTVDHDKREGRFYKGVVRSQYALVNKKPINKISGNFEIKKDLLSLNNFSFGNVMSKGTVALNQYLPLELSFKLDNVEMDNFLSFWNPNHGLLSSGAVSGEIQVAGAASRYKVSGHLSSYDGYVHELSYDSISLNFEGIYPVITLFNSVITRAGSFTFTVDGKLNLNDQVNFDKQIAALDKQPIVNRDNSQLEWTFKRMQKGDESGTTELKYLLKQKNAVGFPDKDDSDMFGVERKIKF